MEQLERLPISSINGEVTLPGSKSLSNRVLLLAALAQGQTRIKNLLRSDDVNHMLTALSKLGIPVEMTPDPTEVLITGMASAFQSPRAELFLGNAGTAMRPLTSALCLGQGEFILTGEPRMEERPIGDLIEPLRQLGANIECLKEEGYPPLKIKANGLQGGKVKIRGNISSQFLTALLMSAPYALNNLEIEVEGELVSKPYINITLDVMKKFGIHVQNENYQKFTIVAGQVYQSPGEVFIEGDASSASYFLSAAAIRGGKIRVYGTGTASVQGDAKFAEVLEQMGAKVKWSKNYIEVEKGELKGVDLDLNHIPDAAMTIATTALFAAGKTTIRNIYNWRVKETDRLNAMATELRKVGAEVVEGNDFIEITPPQQLLKSDIDTYDDHRMAMCFSLCALGNAGIIINDPKCTSKTFPNYFEVFKEISQ
jgi:3-phosphoshikimate 1-carboxyvinyltransferase